MAPKWLSSIRSSLSPKSWLAKHIAQVLNEFFILDGGGKDGEQQVTQIESNLLSDTKIVIRDAKVRPQRIGHDSIWLYGSVQQVEFSWKWTKSAKEGTFVKNTKLSIKGAHFRVVVGAPVEDAGQACAASQDNPPQPSSGSVSTNPLPASSASQEEGYLQRQIQQIIDHLAVDIRDVKLVVEDKGSASSKGGILLQANRLQLVSLGRGTNHKISSATTTPRTNSMRGSFSRVIKKARRSSSSATKTATFQSTNALSHRITLEAINAQVLLDGTDSGRALPLLDPIGYAATMTRVTGRHIVDGWETGLRVEGEILTSSAPGLVLLHAGIEQVSTLSGLLGRLVSLLIDNPASGEEGISNIPSLSSSWSFADVTGPTTTIMLPIPAIGVKLPEGSIVRTPQCSFTCHANGSVCQFRGSEGLWMDQKPVVHFQQSGNGSTACSGEWMVDLVNCKVSLTPTSNQVGTVAQIRWDDQAMTQITKEISLLHSAAAKFARTSSPARSLEGNSSNEGTSSATWILESGGAIQLQVSRQNEYISVKVLSTSIQISIAADVRPKVTALALVGIDVGQASFGISKSTKLHIPAVKLEQGAKGEWAQGIHVDGSVNGVLESPEVAEQLKGFAELLVDGLKCLYVSPNRKVAGRSQSLPLYLRMPLAAIRIQSLDAELLAEGIIARSPFDEVRCRRLEVNQAANGFTLALEGIKAKVAPTFCAKISNIDAFHVPGMGGIEKPIKGITKVVHKGGAIHIETPRLQVQLSDGFAKRNFQTKDSQANRWKLPIPIHCTCPEVDLHVSSFGGLRTSITNLDFHLVPFETSGIQSKGQSVAFQTLVESVDNKFLRLDTATTSGVVKSYDFSTVHQFNLAAELAEVRASASSVDWKSMFDGDVAGQANPIRLPYANVGSLVVSLRWKGPVVGTKRTAATIPPFQGHCNTDAIEVLNHFKKQTVERVAATITDNKLLGPKVSKMTAKTAGAVFTGSEKVVGNVRERIAEGKQSRNAPPGAKYKFGDFARGSFHNAVENIKRTEAEIRRSSELMAEAMSLRAFHI